MEKFLAFYVRMVHLTICLVVAFTLNSVALKAASVYPDLAIYSTCEEMGAAWQIMVNPLSITERETGTEIPYRIQIQCAAVTASSCNNSEIRFPAQSPTTFSLVIPVEDSPVIEDFYFDNATMEWVIDLIDVIPAGSSIEFDINAYVPTDTTPDGTTFEIDATITADNTEPDNDSANGSWTATANMGVAKYLQYGPDADAILDQPIRYYLYPCNLSFVRMGQPGNLFVDRWVLMDMLPADVTFVAASPGGVYDMGANTVTWMDDGTLPLSGCDFAGPTDYWVEIIFPSTIYGPGGLTEATNTTTLTGYPIGAEETPANQQMDSDAIMHGFGTPMATGGFFKRSSTPYYAGRALTFEDDQATFDIGLTTLSTNSQPFYFTVTDPLPCLNNDLGGSNSVYTSNNEGVLCTNPAFQPDDYIRIELGVGYTTLPDLSTFIAENPTLPLRYTATDGSMGVLDVPFESSFSFGGEFAFYQIPWADIEAQLGPGVLLSELMFDSRDIDAQAVPTGQNFRVIFRMYLVGTVAANTVDFPVEDGDRIRNYAYFDLIDEDQSLINEVTENAAVDIVDRGPVLARGKGVNEANGQITLSATSVGEPFRSDDSLIMTDLLPIGYTFQGLELLRVGLCDGNWQWSQSAGDSYNGDCMELQSASVHSYVDIEVIDDYNGTGRQLVRATFLPPPVPDVWEQLGNLRFVYTVNEVPMLLSAVNEMRVFPSSDESSMDLLCLFGNPATPAESEDSNDQDGDGTVSGDAFCSALADIQPTTTVLDIMSYKAVKGDDPVDQEFQPFPAVGAITEIGGTGAFQMNIINTGGVPLQDLVIYDILPHIGDVGLTETQVGNVRDTEFDVIFGGIDLSTLPAGAQVEYSFVNNPCRNELTTAATPPDFPAGCVTDWTTTLGVADTALVRALRITFPAGDIMTLDPGESISIEFDVTYAPGVAPGDVAWNSFAFGAIRTDDMTAILPTEPPKVGLGVPLIDLDLTKSVTPSTVYVGEAVEYCITIDHAGSVTDDGVYTPPLSTATNVVVEDDFLTQGLTIVPGSSSVVRTPDGLTGGAEFDESTGVITIPRIRPNDTYTICYLAYSDTETTATNTAEITAHTEQDVDSTPDNADFAEDDIDDATATWLLPAIDIQKLVETEANSGVYIEADDTDQLSGSYMIGQPINYRFVVRNTGSIALRNVMIEDNLIGSECNTNIGNLGLGQSRTIDCTWPYGYLYSADSIVNVATVTGSSRVNNETRIVTDVDSAEVFTDQVFDLALTKVLNGSGPFRPGDDVTFTITVFNQGNLDAFDISVADYYDSDELSMPMLVGTPAGITDNGDGTFDIAELAAGQMIAFEVSSTISQTFGGLSIVNDAEITGGSTSAGGLDMPDVDSTPGSNEGDPSETVNDNEIVDSDNGAFADDDDDEDDFDPAEITVEQVFDLALIKEEMSSGPYLLGDDVTFTITVYNQSAVEATDVEIIDYLPEGTILNDPDWTDNMDGTASYTLGTIAAATDTSVEITITIDPATTEVIFVNYAEVSSADNPLGLPDEDSTPGDNQGTDETDTDNEVDDDYFGTPGNMDNPADNDDYDGAVFALITCPTLGTITAPENACVGGTFEISIAGLMDMAQADNGATDYGITFVYATMGNTLTNPYDAADPNYGGSLGTVDFASLTGDTPNQIATLSGTGSSLAPGTYRIYAILTPTPNDPTCRPFAEVGIRVLNVDCGDFPWGGN